MLLFENETTHEKDEMTAAVFAGVGLTMVAGVMAGNCMLPSKFVRTWKWENLWLVFSVVSLVILPWALALLLVKHLFAAYSGLAGAAFVTPVVFGAGWGVAQILFGISVRRLGLGIAYAIIVGLGAVLGTLIPLFFGPPVYISHATLTTILTGVVVMIAGIALTAIGGKQREDRGELREGSGYATAILLAILCGIMAPMLNFAFAFGQRLAQQAVFAGNTPVRAAYAVWPIALLGGFVPNAAYSVFLLWRGKTWKIFRQDRAEVIWPTLMAVLWMGAFALYGMSAVYLGALGVSVGWGLFQSFMIITATVSGVLTAEWKSAPRSAMILLTLGLVFLLLATLLLSTAGR
ncbi:MAG TPA: L-rhamnose/proton symporter RhaT [Acidobacteriaceae bacterium]|jgi:L-rhamnose-H+ transport protein